MNQSEPDAMGLAEQPAEFVDRRQQNWGPNGTRERRQFVDTRSHLRPEIAEMAAAIDGYKLANCRRFITMEELFNIIEGLGYRKSTS